MSNNPATNYNKKYQNKANHREDNAKHVSNHEVVTAKETVCEPKAEVKVDDSFSVKVDIDYLNIRKGPGMDCERTGNFTGKGIFVITEVKSGIGSTAGWGRLESGEGWISLDYATRV